MSHSSERFGRPWYLAAIVLGLLLLAATACTGPTVPQNEPTATIAPAVTATPPPVATAFTETVKIPVAPPSPIPSPTAATAAPPTATAIRPPTPQPASGRGSLIYTTQSGDKLTRWIASAEGGKPVQIGSQTVPGVAPQDYVGSLPRNVLTSSDGRVLLMHVRERSAIQPTPQPGMGSQPAVDEVLYAFLPDGTNRREVARGQMVMLLGAGAEWYGYGAITTATVDRSLSPDGKKLWLSVMTGGSGPYNTPDTMTWYTWDVEKGERKEVLTGKLFAEDAEALVATTPDYSKALVVKGNIYGRGWSTSPATPTPTTTPPKLVVQLFDLATGARRDLATIDRSSSGWAGAKLTPDGKSALILGPKTLLVDLASGKSTDLGVAGSRSAMFTPDGKSLLLQTFKVEEGKGTGPQAVVVDLATLTAKPIPNLSLELATTDDQFVGDTSLIALRGSEGKETTLYLIDVASGAVEKLAFGFQPRALYLPRSGRLAVYYSLPQTGSKGSPETTKLILLDPKAPKNRAELTLSGDLATAVESPDGKSLFVAAPTHGASGRAQLLKIDLANPKPVELVSAAQITNLQLSPDGASIAYTQLDKVGGSPSIYTMSFDGSKPQKVVAEGTLERWVPARMGLAVTTLAPALAAAPPPTPTAQATPATAEPPRVQLSNQTTHLVVTSTLGYRGTLWMVDRLSGKVTPLASGDIPDQYAYQLPQGPLRALAPSDGRFLLARVLESDPAKQASQAAQGESRYPGQTVLYAFSPNGTNRRELGRGSQIVLLGEEIAGGGSVRAYAPENAYPSGVPNSAVDRSLSADGRKLWFAVIGGTSSRELPFDTITWYSWDVQTGERQERLVTKLSASDGRYIVDTTPGLSKALLVKGASPYQKEGPLPAGSKSTLLLLDTATGATRELATVTAPDSIHGWGGAFGSRLSEDGSKALAFGQKTLLIDTASGKSVDLGVANSVGGALTADGTRGFVFRQVSTESQGMELYIVDVTRATAKPIAGRTFEMSRGYMSPGYATDLFFPGTSLAVVRGAEQTKGGVWYLVDASSGAVQELAQGSVHKIEYLPRAGRLAVSMGGKLLLLDPKAPASRTELDLPGERMIESVIESPDGKHVAALGTKAFVIDLASPKPVDVAPGKSVVGLQFSPDGSKVAYTQSEGVYAETGRPTGPYSISIVGLDGMELDPAVHGAVLQQWLP